MIGKHLDRRTLKRLLERDLEPEEATRLTWHLAHCETCRVEVEGASAQSTGVLARLFGQPGPWSPPLATARYGRVLSRVKHRLVEEEERLRQDLRQGPELVHELLACPAPVREAMVADEERFHRRAVAEHLLDHCRQLWAEDPAAAEALAGLARTVLEKLERGGMSSAQLADLSAQQWAYAGNIRRIRSDLRSAEVAFEEAESCLARGTGDPVARGELLALEATLRRDQRRLREALVLLNQAATAFHKAGDRHLVGRVLLKKALVYSDAGNPERGITVLRKAMEHIDSRREPRLRLAAQEQLVFFLNQAGRHWEALTLLPEAHRTAEEVGSRLDRLRVLWVEGLIALDLSWYERAEKALTRVRRGFAEEEIGYDTALVSLDLASLYLRQARTAETRQLALEMLPIFQSRDIHREALAALMVFRRAVEIETVTLGMVEDIADYLKKARHNPELAYEQPS